MQIGKIGKALHILRDHQVDVDLPFRAFLAGGLHRNRQRFFHGAFPIQIVVHRPFLRRFLLRHDGGQVIVGGLGVLFGDDGIERVRDAEPCHQQRRTPRHPDDRHPEPPLVAQQVAAGDLPGKGKAPPQRGDALQQDTFARLGRTRQHQRGRDFLQRGAAGQRRDADGQHDERTAREQRLGQTPGGSNGGHVIHHGIS